VPQPRRPDPASLGEPAAWQISRLAALGTALPPSIRLDRWLSLVGFSLCDLANRRGSCKFPAVKKWLFMALIACAVWWLWLSPEPPAHWGGRAASETPRQTTAELPRPWTRDGMKFEPLARFAMRGVVLSRERYRYDPEAALAPVDLALGWGRMSEAAVINALRISQDHRWYEYGWRQNPPIPQEEIALSSANMHLIPANGTVRAAILAVRRHDLVEFQGYLVEVTRPGWRWRSSLSREDTGGHSCEVVWVDHLERRAP